MDNPSPPTFSFFVPSQPPSFLPWFLPKTQIQKLFWTFIETENMEFLYPLFNHPLVDINGKMLDDWTAVHLATNEGKVAALQGLIQNGGNIEALTKYNKTPLHIACMRGNLKICKILIEAGCKRNSMDCYYKTPLQYAEEGGWEDVSQYLRNMGATRLGAKGAVDKIDIPIRDVNDLNRIKISDFYFYGKLGEGGFGQVFLVKWKHDSKFYAMKILDKETYLQKNMIKYAKTERNILRLMNHPFIVKLKHAFQTREKLIMVMEYCSGGKLGKGKEKFSEEVARIYASEILLALEELHKNMIIFRDLKLDNVLLDEDGHAILTDFGLSKEGINGASIIGTKAYIAPEIMRVSQHDRTIDWYLFGAFLYEMLVGMPPFFDMNPNKMKANIMNGENLFLPPFLSTIVMDLLIKLLRTDPEKRLGSQNDSEDIKSHSWFNDIDWHEVLNKGLVPPKVTPLFPTEKAEFKEFVENADDPAFFECLNRYYVGSFSLFMNT